MPPGAGGPPPAKKSPGLKYALVGCGCLLLIATGALLFTLATGGVATYFAKKAATPGGPDCAAAAACCEKILAKSGTADRTACTQLKSAPAIACAQSLKVYKRSAASLGITCP
jgi:hypothetical protein